MAWVLAGAVWGLIAGVIALLLGATVQLADRKQRAERASRLEASISRHPSNWAASEPNTWWA